MGTDLVQEVAVVRDDDHRAVAVVEHVLEPADGVDVEVVGRLVEQQDVGLANSAWASSTRSFQPGATSLIGPLCSSVGMPTPSSSSPARASACSRPFAEWALELGGVHVVVFGGVRVGVDRVASP